MNVIIRCAFKSNLVNKNVYSCYRFSTSSNYRANVHEAIPLKLSCQSISERYAGESVFTTGATASNAKVKSSALIVPDKYEPIEEFYAGKSVLITGGTGFVGKVLIEKLLYSCPGLENIYVLVRDKKNVNGRERIKRLLENKVFSRIRKEKPENLKKINLVTGDITSGDLGVTKEDKAMILDKVSVVFHLAASVRFNETLKEAVKINVEGTINTMQFARQIKALQAFVHMSTAFCNTDKLIVEEIVYPIPMSLEDVYKYLDGGTNYRLDEILQGRPNTYTFAKALAESVIAESIGDMPTTIIRPSIVTASMHDPFRGWIDSWFGCTAALDMMAKGWFKCFYGKKHYSLDVIPVDYVANATIVAAARTQRSKKLAVYNCCTSTINRITFQEISTLYRKQSIKSGYNQLWLNNMMFTKSPIVYHFMTYTFMLFPAYLFDLRLILRREPTKYVKQTQRFMLYLDQMTFISFQDWFMISTRFRDLAEDLDEADRQKFPCNPAEINWPDYIRDYFHGVLKYLVRSER